MDARCSVNVLFSSLTFVAVPNDPSGACSLT
jgi:hypothetical protein